MSQPNKKVDNDDNIDRITGLPCNIINNILERLPIPDLMRTTILSWKWKYMWILVPRLEFENAFFEKCKHLDYLETSGIITDLLFLHNDSIYKFALRIPSDYQIKIESLNKWVLFLSRKGIKDLELENQQIDPYQIPCNLFSCQELTYLELHNFKLSIPPTFDGFKSLLDLHLSDITFESGALESLMLGCQLLVELTISYCSGFQHINIFPTTLKVLYIEGHKVIKLICLEQAQNLINLTLMADRPGDNFERGRVSDLMKGLPKIEMLRLGTGYIKILFAGINPQVLLRSVHMLKRLELNGVNFNEATELSYVISLLEGSKNLQELALKSYSKAVGQQVLKDFDYVNCSFIHLRTVNITVKTAYKPALNLIRLVLANSPSLQVLTFKLGLGLNPSDISILLSISSDLMEMKRASPKANLKFLYDGLVE